MYLDSRDEEISAIQVVVIVVVVVVVVAVVVVVVVVVVAVKEAVKVVEVDRLAAQLSIVQARVDLPALATQGQAAQVAPEVPADRADRAGAGQVRMARAVLPEAAPRVQVAARTEAAKEALQVRVVQLPVVFSR